MPMPTLATLQYVQLTQFVYLIWLMQHLITSSLKPYSSNLVVMSSCGTVSNACSGMIFHKGQRTASSCRIADLPPRKPNCSLVSRKVVVFHGLYRMWMDKGFQTLWCYTFEANRSIFTVDVLASFLVDVWRCCNFPCFYFVALIMKHWKLLIRGRLLCPWLMNGSSYISLSLNLGISSSFSSCPCLSPCLMRHLHLLSLGW